MTFELTEVTECTLTHVNLRKEFHGDEKVQAIDLNFSIEGSNDLLDLVDPALREMHYFNRAEVVGQETLPGTIRILPDLRAPKLNGQKFKYGGNDKYKGYGFEKDFGLGAEAGSNLFFTDASAGKFSYETKEGGTVKLEFQVSYSGDALTDDAMTRLVRAEGEKVFIKLLAPSVLTLVKGGKAPKAADPEDGEQLDVLGDSEEEDDGNETPEAAFTAAHAG
ncbi:MAG: hypothetical protein V4730_11870 [Pseudomonadota bacterium]